MGHLLVLPFCDLVLLMTNTAIAVIISNLLSIWILNEQAVYKYDIPAIICLTAGCLTIVFLANYDEINYSAERVVELLTMPVSIVIYTLYAIWSTCTYVFNRWYRRSLRGFEKDLNNWFAHMINQHEVKEKNSFCASENQFSIQKEHEDLEIKEEEKKSDSPKSIDSSDDNLPTTQ